MKNTLKLALTLTLTIATLALFGCGEEAKDGGGTPLGPDASVDLTGSWRMTETVDATACGEGVYSRTYTVVATQTGNRLTVVTEGGTFSGTVQGVSVNWSGQYPEEGGTLTITGMNLSSNGAADRLTGTSNWRWSDGSFTCSGDTQVQGIRIQAIP